MKVGQIPSSPFKNTVSPKHPMVAPTYPNQDTGDSHVQHSDHDVNGLGEDEHLISQVENFRVSMGKSSISLVFLKGIQMNPMHLYKKMLIEMMVVS